MSRNWINLKKGVHEYIIEQGLPDGGSFLAPPAAKPLRLEYFGDSITDGAGIGHPHVLAEAPHLDDGYMSYVGISARMLNAEYHTMAICGIGVWQDAVGNKQGLPEHFFGTLGKGTAPWDFSLYVPDGIVINLGQNDYSTPIDDEAYIAAYIEFIRVILEKYNDPYIFCCVGTMNNNYLASVNKVVTYFNQSGNRKVFVVDLGLIHPEVEGWGGRYHPGYQTHYRMGWELASFISANTGWELLKRPLIATEGVF